MVRKDHCYVPQPLRDGPRERRIMCCHAQGLNGWAGRRSRHHIRSDWATLLNRQRSPDITLRQSLANPHDPSGGLPDNGTVSVYGEGRWHGQTTSSKETEQNTFEASLRDFGGFRTLTEIRVVRATASETAFNRKRCGTAVASEIAQRLQDLPGTGLLYLFRGPQRKSRAVVNCVEGSW